MHVQSPHKILNAAALLVALLCAATTAQNASSPTSTAEEVAGSASPPPPPSLPPEGSGSAAATAPQAAGAEQMPMNAEGEVDGGENAATAAPTSDEQQAGAEPELDVAQDPFSSSGSGFDNGFGSLEGMTAGAPNQADLFTIPTIPPLEDFTLPPTPSPPPTEAPTSPPPTPASVGNLTNGAAVVDSSNANETAKESLQSSRQKAPPSEAGALRSNWWAINWIYGALTFFAAICVVLSLFLLWNCGLMTCSCCRHEPRRQRRATVESAEPSLTERSAVSWNNYEVASSAKPAATV